MLPHAQPLPFTFRAVLALLLLLLAIHAPAVEPLHFPPPDMGNLGPRSGGNGAVSVATNGTGFWMAVWASTDTLGGAIDDDLDLLMSTSSDDGDTWTTPVPVNNNATTDTGSDHYPVVRHEANFTFLVVWESAENWLGAGTDSDILAARTINGGQNWYDPVHVNDADADSGYDGRPDLVSDGMGHWLCVWESTENIDTLIGEDRDILFATSTNTGVTWTTPQALNPNAETDTLNGWDFSPRVATDGSDWLCVWHSWEPTVGEDIGADADLLCASSLAGAAWGNLSVVNSDAPTDTGSDLAAQVATDGTGNWVVVWQGTDSATSALGTDNDLFYTRSTNLGATWSDAAPLHASAVVDGAAEDVNPRIAADGSGNMLVLWDSEHTSPGGIGADRDIASVFSNDAGLTWSDVEIVNSNATTDGNAADYTPAIATNNAGGWMSMWTSDTWIMRGGTPATHILFAYAQWPEVDGIFLSGPNPTNERPAQFALIFTEDVTGVDLSDLALNDYHISDPVLDDLSGSGTLYLVDVAYSDGSGTLEVELHDDDTIVDAHGNPLGGPGADNGTFTTGQFYSIDTYAPYITVEGENPLTLECVWLAMYMDAHATAQDKEEGDVTGSIVVTGGVDAGQPDTYTVTYTASDSVGNSSQASRTVYVVDTTPPEITVLPPDPLTATCGSPYMDPGATVADDCDPAAVLSASPFGVNVDRAGTYRVNYIAQDATGLLSTAHREVIVDPPCGEGEGEGYGTVACPANMHTADLDASMDLSLSELLRVVQFFNRSGLHCEDWPGVTEDGYYPETGLPIACCPHHSDYAPQDWFIDLSELLRTVQLYNAGSYAPCHTGEDGFCLGGLP